MLLSYQIKNAAEKALNKGDFSTLDELLKKNEFKTRYEVTKYAAKKQVNGYDYTYFSPLDDYMLKKDDFGHRMGRKVAKRTALTAGLGGLGYLAAGPLGALAGAVCANRGPKYGFKPMDYTSKKLSDIINIKSYKTRKSRNAGTGAALGFFSGMFFGPLGMLIGTIAGAAVGALNTRYRFREKYLINASKKEKMRLPKLEEAPVLTA